MPNRLPGNPGAAPDVARKSRMNRLAPNQVVDHVDLRYSGRLLRLKEVCRRTGKSRSDIYRNIAEGRFPAPVKLGERSSAWVESEISDWVAARIAERDAGRSK